MFSEAHTLPAPPRPVNEDDALSLAVNGTDVKDFALHVSNVAKPVSH